MSEINYNTIVIKHLHFELCSKIYFGRLVQLPKMDVLQFEILQVMYYAKSTSELSFNHRSDIQITV